MIGGYVYDEPDAGLDERLRDRLAGSCTRTDLWDRGYLFHDAPYPDKPPSRVLSDRFAALTQDLLVGPAPGGGYRRHELQPDFAERLAADEAAAFDSILSDFRMAVVRRQGEETTLYLVSNRAGSGRIYYHTATSGVVFSSDLRFLLGVIDGEVNPLGIYSILKYGAVPEPLTICSDVRAVRPAHYLRHEVRTGRQRQLPYFRLRFECEGDARGTTDEREFLPPVRDALRRSASFLATERPAILLSGGIDSSLYGCYLGEASDEPPPGLYCVFGDDDPELEFARAIAKRIGSELHVASMGVADALRALDSVARWTDHPFADFSSLPIAFLLEAARQRVGPGTVLVECNGGDDCFGFPDLRSERKQAWKHAVPAALKRSIAPVLGRTSAWKWESSEGALARLCAVVDAHESSALDYFLVMTPVPFLGLRTRPGWDEALWEVLHDGFVRAVEGYDDLGYGAKTTVRQLLQVNGRRWAAKALSVGESLGLRVTYPYIWRDVLRVQGRVPWDAKVRDGVVKWPLKRLLEEHMPASFIYRKKSGFVPPFARWLSDDGFNRRVREILLDRDAAVAEVAPPRVLERLLADALGGRALRHPILNFLWGALFTTLWVREHAG
jgi:asparagine synthase (glutamine-hydrolysing)